MRSAGATGANGTRLDPIAAEWLKRAKKADGMLGWADEWQAYLQQTREKYSRRRALPEQLRHL